MGTSKSPAEFSRKITHMATITERHKDQTVGRGAFATKNIIYETATARGVTPTSKIAGGKWGVRYNVAQGSALVRIFGPFHLVDRATKPHPLGPRKTGRRRSGKKAIAFNGIVRASAQHPGTRGKRIFGIAKMKAAKVAPVVMSQSVISGWQEALK